MFQPWFKTQAALTSVAWSKLRYKRRSLLSICIWLSLCMRHTLSRWSCSLSRRSSSSRFVLVGSGSPGSQLRSWRSCPLWWDESWRWWREECHWMRPSRMSSSLPSVSEDLPSETSWVVISCRCSERWVRVSEGESYFEQFLELSLLEVFHHPAVV